MSVSVWGIRYIYIISGGKMPPLANLPERLLRSGLASIVKALSCSSNSHMLTTAQIIHARLFIINILPSRTSTACQRFRTRKRGKFFCISSYNQSNPAADFKVGTTQASSLGSVRQLTIEDFSGLKKRSFGVSIS